MSREIDRVPEPASKKKIKLVVASCSRSGTLGLYSATKILGFRPYHFYEMVVYGGASHMRIVQDAILAEHNRISGVKKMDKGDMDKWLADYDCLIELPSYFNTRALETYAEDPDVKFILTERDPDKWVKSFNNTAGGNVKMAGSFPMNILKRFNEEIYEFMYLNELAYWCYSKGLAYDHPNCADALRDSYVEYIENAKKVLPKDRTLVIKLEDGLGWETICPFLGIPIPDEPYPSRNEPEKFKELLMSWLNPRIQSALLKMGALVVPVLGVTGYFGWRYWVAR